MRPFKCNASFSLYLRQNVDNWQTCEAKPKILFVARLKSPKQRDDKFLACAYSGDAEMNQRVQYLPSLPRAKNLTP